MEAVREILNARFPSKFPTVRLIGIVWIIIASVNRETEDSVHEKHEIRYLVVGR